MRFCPLYLSLNLSTLGLHVFSDVTAIISRYVVIFQHAQLSTSANALPATIHSTPPDTHSLRAAHHHLSLL